MTKLLCRITCFAMIIGSVCLVLLKIPVKSSEPIALFKDKFTLLENSRRNKIVIIGGSGGFVGIDSKLVSEQLGYDVINLCLFAGFGLEVYLDEVKKYLNNGDIVLIIPEYVLLYNNKGFRPYDQNAIKWIVRTCSFNQLYKVYCQYDNYKYIIRNFSEITNDKLKILFTGIINNNITSVLGHGCIERDEFIDKYGDRIKDTIPKLPSMKLEGRGMVLKKQFDDNNVVDILNSFSDFTNTQGVKSFFMYSCLPYEEYMLNVLQLANLHAFMSSNLKTRILGNPESFVFPVELFLDTINHLDAGGKRQRTIIVLNLLQTELKSVDNP